MTGKGEPHVRHVRTRQSGQTALAIPWFFPETLPAVPARNHRRLGHPANPEQLRHAYAFVRADQSRPQQLACLVVSYPVRLARCYPQPAACGGQPHKARFSLFFPVPLG